MPKFNHLKQPFYYVHSRLGIQLGQSISAPQYLGPQLENLRLEQLRLAPWNCLVLFTRLPGTGQDDSKTRTASHSACMACLCSLGFLILCHFRVVILEGWDCDKKYSIGKDRSCPTSGVANRHSHFILLVEAALSPPWFKRKSHGLWLLMEGPVLELLWCVQGAIMITMMLISYGHIEQSGCSKDHSKLSSCINSESFHPKAYHYSCFPGREMCKS